MSVSHSINGYSERGAMSEELDALLGLLVLVGALAAFWLITGQ